MSDESAECPLCMEALEIDDHSFFPCTCGYQICRFCWHRIRSDENGLCPACRKQYPEDPAEFKPLTEDELQSIKKERKQKDAQRKQKAAENRKHLANVRVVQRNLVFVVGLSPRLADPEVLKKHEYFGKFGKIHKVVINQSTSYAGSQASRQGPSASAYVTYVKPEDALRAILTVNNVHVEGRTLKTSLGTTKYCSHFLKGTHCQKNDCMYLHELGEQAASFTKDEMQAGKHQDYEQMLIEQFLNAQNSANNHVMAHSKLKKSGSPQSIDNPVIPSLMDMTGDIKHTGPLLPNPVAHGVNGQTPHHPHSSGWPLLDTKSSADQSSSTSNSNKPQVHTNPRGGGQNGRSSTSPDTSSGGSTNGCKAIGSGRQKSNGTANPVNGTEENHLTNGSLGSSSSSIGSGSPSGVEEELSTSPNHPLPQSLSPREPSPLNNTAVHLQASQHPIGVPEEVASSVIGAIGSNRRPLLSDPSGAQSLSFFGNNLLQTPDASLASTVGHAQPASTSPRDPMAAVTSQQEMSDSLPVSTGTDWSAAFGFDSKDLPPDDDLGFDPCAESFKGLADLMEKENSCLQQQQQQQQFLSSSAPQGRLGSPTFPTPAHLPPSPQQTSNQPSLRNLPPGFSLSHIQQQQQLQQQQQFFRPELSGSKMLDLLPQFPSVSSQQRFNPMQQSYNNMPLDLHSHTQQQPQHDLYNMKDMQEQLRSMLPNINISFGSMPQETTRGSGSPSNLPPHMAPVPPQQQPNPLNRSWPMSSSPSSSSDAAAAAASPWNDPAILTATSHLSSAEDNLGAPHWLKSLQQLTESEGTSPLAPSMGGSQHHHHHLPHHHRLPFVQQFPMAGAGGWPPHTHNPPPGFRAQQPVTDAHQMAEVLQ